MTMLWSGVNGITFRVVYKVFGKRRFGGSGEDLFFVCKYSADNVVEWELITCVCVCVNELVDVMEY